MHPYTFIVYYEGKQVARKTILAPTVNMAWMRIIEMYESDCDFELVK